MVMRPHTVSSSTVSSSTASSSAPADPHILAQLREQIGRIEQRSAPQQAPQQAQKQAQKQAQNQAEPVPTHSALAELLQLRAGASYAVDSAILAITLMAGSSAEGGWCAVVGSAELGLPAAAAAGVELDRTIIVPEPGDQWRDVIAALIDAVQVIVFRPDTPISESVASRLTARLRARGAVLVTWGEWPRPQAKLRVTDSVWHGLGQGHGHLRARQATVEVCQNGAPARTVRLWLPDGQQRIRIINENSDQPNCDENGTNGLAPSLRSVG